MEELLLAAQAAKGTALAYYSVHFKLHLAPVCLILRGCAKPWQDGSQAPGSRAEEVAIPSHLLPEIYPTWIGEMPLVQRQPQKPASLVKGTAEPPAPLHRGEWLAWGTSATPQPPHSLPATEVGLAPESTGSQGDWLHSRIGSAMAWVNLSSQSQHL